MFEAEPDVLVDDTVKNSVQINQIMIYLKEKKVRAEVLSSFKFKLIEYSKNGKFEDFYNRLYQKASNVDDYVAKWHREWHTFDNKLFTIVTIGVGPGELVLVLAIKDCKSLQAEHGDLIVTDKIYEVKALQAPDDIRLAKSGFISGTKFWDNFGDLSDVIKDIVDETIFQNNSELKKVIEVVKSINTSPNNIAGGLLKDLYKAVKSFKEKNSDSLKSDKTILTVTKDGENKDFLLDKEEANKIEPNTKVNLRIGNDDEYSVVLGKFLNHQWFISQDNIFISDLKDIIANYVVSFGEAFNGMIIFTNKNASVAVYTREQIIKKLIIYRISNGIYKVAVFDNITQKSKNDDVYKDQIV